MKEQDVIGAVESIIDAWDDWDAEASQAAQHEQNPDVWRFVMRDHIRNCLARATATEPAADSGNIVKRLNEASQRMLDLNLPVSASLMQEASGEIEYLRQRCEQIDHEYRIDSNGQKIPFGRGF
jgi:hypothetical protein